MNFGCYLGELRAFKSQRYSNFDTLQSLRFKCFSVVLCGETVTYLMSCDIIVYSHVCKCDTGTLGCEIIRMHLWSFQYHFLIDLSNKLIFHIQSC
jgi:hypothetical protein